VGVDDGNTNCAGRILLCARTAKNEVRPIITPFVTVRSARSNFAVTPGQKSRYTFTVISALTYTLLKDTCRGTYLLLSVEMGLTKRDRRVENLLF
jgi:hypothetical protein